jgi:hypothetical protein
VVRGGWRDFSTTEIFGKKSRLCHVCVRLCSVSLLRFPLVGPMVVEPTCLVVSLVTCLCTRMVLVLPSATHGQVDGAAWAMALLPWD